MTNPQPPDDIAERIRRIENGLTPATGLWGQVVESLKLTDRMDYSYKVPGVSMAVIHNYRIEWARGYGVLEAGRPDLITLETLFQAASISKPVVAMAALRLVEEGKLDLDEDVNKFLVSWKVPGNASWQSRVTLRHLLSHTAGLTVHGFSGYPRAHELPTLFQILDGKEPANSPAVEVSAIPGAQFRYSGGGYCVIQQLLIDVTGKPFPEIMQELVLDPLGMEHSTYEQPLPESRSGSAATGHRWDGEPVDGQWHVYPEMAAAGLWTTPSDLARFTIELQRSKVGQSNNVLSGDMVNQMLTPQFEDSIGLGVFQFKDSIGLGLFLESKGESSYFEHSGANAGFCCKLVTFIDCGLGAIVMTSSDNGSPLIEEILQAIAREYRWPGYISDIS
ncbi:MAG: serine hydrolase domain-containing protein [Candidatus Bipolaricaulia bacterium]